MPLPEPDARRLTTTAKGTLSTVAHNAAAEWDAMPDVERLAVLRQPLSDQDETTYMEPLWSYDRGNHYRLGGNFILDTDPDPTPLWGEGRDVLLAEGESLIIAGNQGLGKTTLAQQLALGLAGIEEYDNLLGYPVMSYFKVLYLAMDRPRQAARSFQRMVGEAHRDELDSSLIVWQGPPLADLAKRPDRLAMMATEAGVDADAIVVDSLKDAAVGLSDDEVGAGWNRARQTALEAGIQLVELHHNRKTIGGAKAARPTIDDLYGSTWLTSGTGSVLLLSGAPGDPIVGLHHVKQPANEVGPLKVIHDNETGRSTIWHAADLVAMARSSESGLTALDAARSLYEVDRPSAAQRQKARRRLEGLAATGSVYLIDPGDRRANRPARWAAK